MGTLSYSPSSAAYLPPKLPNSLLRHCCPCFHFPNSYASFLTLKPPTLFRTKSVIVAAKKTDAKNKKDDSHRFVPKPDEATGFFPEAVLLKKKSVTEDGKALPEFADAEEEKLYEYLNLQLESQLNVKQMRHYEVVYLIHEKNAEEVEKVNEKVQDFLREKKGKVWRVSDWGMRRLAYKIKKAKQAHYILMNFELEAKWINEFKSMLDMDERVIRHLVIKQDAAITEDCPPPPEFHTLRTGMDDDSEENDDVADFDDEDDDMDWDGEEESEEFGDEMEDGIIMVKSDDDEGKRKTSRVPPTSSNKGLVNKRT